MPRALAVNREPEGPCAISKNTRKRGFGFAAWPTEGKIFRGGQHEVRKIVPEGQSGAHDQRAVHQRAQMEAKRTIGQKLAGGQHASEATMTRRLGLLKRVLSHGHHYALGRAGNHVGVARAWGFLVAKTYAAVRDSSLAYPCWSGTKTSAFHRTLHRGVADNLVTRAITAAVLAALSFDRISCATDRTPRRRTSTTLAIEQSGSFPMSGAALQS